MSSYNAALRVTSRNQGATSRGRTRAQSVKGRSGQITARQNADRINATTDRFIQKSGGFDAIVAKSRSFDARSF